MEALSVLFPGDWDSRDQTTVDKMLGQNFGASITSWELYQDAILMTSSYRQNRPRSIYQYSSMAPRLSGQNCKFFKFLLSLNSQRRLGYKENNTKYRSLTWKPRSHVRILIYRTWSIVYGPHWGKAAGYDNIPMSIIKESIQIISEPLAHIINLSIAYGIVPDQMKIARVVPPQLMTRHCLPTIGLSRSYLAFPNS